MAGVEAVGLVLGILPLLMSAAEHYEDVFRPFKRYRKFAPELETYQQQLGTQKTIFRNECHWLLATLLGRQNAREMLRDRGHQLWSDEALDLKLSRQLGESSTSCKSIIDLIQAKLRSIEEETESFGLVIQQSIPIGSIGDKAWRSRVGKKLKFGFSEPRLEKCLKKLRDLNNDFRTLAAQTIRLDSHQIAPASVAPVVARSDKKLQESRLVQRVSGQLYTALARACQIHDQHSAHFRLESQHVNIEDNGLSLVRFNIAFSHHRTTPSTLLEPVWLAVDSTIDDTIPDQRSRNEKARHQAQIALDGLSNNLKRELSPPFQVSTKKFRSKSVRFAAPNAALTLSSKETVVASFVTDASLPDFCVQNDFCKQLQACDPSTLNKKYLGYLEKFGTCKHLVYFAPPITAERSRQTATLGQIVKSLSQKPGTDHLLQYERLRLARQLASAVLQFHATPLLKRTWRSDDVVFFGQASLPHSIEFPHLSVQVGKPASVLLEPNALTADSADFIRNPYLFGLGVTLIELAYQAPLRSLQEDRDLTNGEESNHTDFFVADRLSRSMGTSLGVSYAKVVRKCLGCDFGEGTTDLNDPGLQSVFYKDVVCELERLERAFVMLQLAT